MSGDDLNSCLRGELAAIETYQQALEKVRGEHEADARFQQLADMLRDHQEAAAKLRELIAQTGATPTNDSGAWGTWSKTVMGAAKIFGDKAALKALKEGEEDGLKQYDRLAAQDDATASQVRSTAATLATRNRQHIRALDLLIDSA